MVWDHKTAPKNKSLCAFPLQSSIDYHSASLIDMHHHLASLKDHHKSVLLAILLENLVF